MASENVCAETIIQHLKKSSSAGFAPTNIIVFTDIGRDIDDACFLTILSYLHKIKVAQILLVVTNVDPSESRAKAAKFIFERLGVRDVPVAYGGKGTDGEVDLQDYEFEGLGEPKGAVLDAQTALLDSLKTLERNQQQCSIIVISSLRDLWYLIQEHGDLVRNTVSSVFLQGACEVDNETQNVKTLVPDMKAMNNSYDPAATSLVYSWLLKNVISSYVITRHSAFKSPISPKVFRDAAEAGNVVAKYIYHAFGEQEREFYRNASQPDPAKRFLPHLDKRWYTMRTGWPENHGEGELPETFEDVQPFLRMTLYDVVAGLICPLLKYSFVEQVYQPYRQSVSVGDQIAYHYIVGRSVDGPDKAVFPDVNTQLLSNLIVELLKRALASN